MKFTPSAFRDDLLTLTWRDILMLLLGKTLKNGALIVRREKEIKP